MPLDLTPSAIYRRTELHRQYGGQSQGGISTPAGHPVVLIFTGYARGQHGYADGWSEGVFCYFGEGQSGDMEWVRGNLAIRDHIAQGRDLLLFEMLKTPRSHVRFLGPFACASWEYRRSPDRSGSLRQAIVFHLAPLSEEPTTANQAPSPTASLADLRMAAIAAEAETPAKVTGSALQTYLERSRAIRDYALARAFGTCECCKQPAPFLTLQGLPFLEVHHLRRLADGGPDRINAVAAVCPNCHREVHFGTHRESLNGTLTATIRAKEQR